MSVRKRKWTTAKGEKKEAWVADYVDGAGERHIKTFDRKKGAEAFASTVAVEIREGTHVPDAATVTVKQAGEKWIATCEAAGLERSTLHQYRTHLEQHIVPFIGRLMLPKLSVPAIRAFQDKLRNEGRSAIMVKRVTVSLGSILSDAQERGLVGRNAIREMTKVRKKGGAAERRQKVRLRVGVDIPTREEVSAIIRHASGRYRPFLLTAIFAGLRASELRGLRWIDVDLAKAILHVRQRADRYQEIGMPKSDAGQRAIPLSPLVVNTLREWKLACPKRVTVKADAQGEPIRELELVFPNGEGNIEWHGNIINRGLIPVQFAAGVTIDTGKKDQEGNPVLAAKYTGLHALRHFYASWCINRRADGGLELPPKTVQERMGHSSIVMTMDTYGHLFPSKDDGEALAEAERQLLAAI